MDMSRLVPGVVVGIGALFVLMFALPESPSTTVPLNEFAKIPVVADGRIKPMDTVARNNLMIISKRQSFKDQSGKTQPALVWLLDSMVSNLDRQKSVGWKHRVFRIENDQVLGLLDLEMRPGSLRYSLSELAPKMEKLEEESRRISRIDPKPRTLYEQKVLELASHVDLYIKLSQWREPRIIPTSADENAEWLTLPDVQAKAFDEAWERLRRDAKMIALADERLEKDFKDPKDREKLDAAGREAMRRHYLRDELRSAAFDLMLERYPAAVAWTRILHAYQSQNATEFSKAVEDFRRHQGPVPASAVRKARFEVFFNHFQPFYLCTVLYILVFLLSVVGWIAYPEILNRSALCLAMLTLGVHTFALGARMYIQGRPPVTNLYSSAVFIGWGCVLLGLILEWLYKKGVGNVVASVTGALTVLVAHHLAESSGDTLEMMQAVLDTNFWLATHVTCITLGYSATFFAGFLGILFILLGVFTTRLDRDMFVSLGQMIYGVVCFATLLSFVGTVLGGIWADQSWGRFWGWDPKENGALLIVLMNALILHARWGGMIKQRGMAVLAIVGNMITGWSWFGTNQLGVGLHAYGFNSTLATGLTIFWASQLVCILIGLTPTSKWQSFGQPRAEAAPERRHKPRGGKQAPATASS